MFSDFRIVGGELVMESVRKRAFDVGRSFRNTGLGNEKLARRALVCVSYLLESHM